jgi:segregation and condensation protein A
MAANIPAVRAGQFEGPLDLLLALVRQHQVELEELPIATVTSQYLEYLEAAGDANIELGADFIYMAATLIQLKSASLLPRDRALSPTAGAAAVDERRSLIDRLREHARTVEAAALLEQRLTQESAAWSNPPAEFGRGRDTDAPGAGAGVPRKASLADLIEVLETAMARTSARTRILIDADPYTVEERMAWLRGLLAARGLPVPAGGLFGKQPTRSALACLFLAMLELARNGEVRLDQREPFGEIVLQ